MRCDIAFGGAFYAYVDVKPLGITVNGENVTQLIDVGRRIKQAVMASYDIRHPEGDPDLNFLYGTILVQMLDGDAHSRNVCIFADGEVDRSPTGTGVSGRLAIHYAQGDLALHQRIVIESLIGTSFSGRVVETTDISGYPGIIPEVTGSAFITGINRLLIDPDDPLKDGFILR